MSLLSTAKKFLNGSGLLYFYNKLVDKLQKYTIGYVKTYVLDKLGVANGIATLDGNSKLKNSQIPTLKTINGNSIVGSGNIEIDLSIYTVVNELPTTGLPNKIYLVVNPESTEDSNEYVEYSYINGKWEELGKYIAKVDLTPYVLDSELDEKVEQLNYVKSTNIPTATDTVTGGFQTGYLQSGNNYAVKLHEGKAYVEVDATKDEAISDSELDEILV